MNVKCVIMIPQIIAVKIAQGIGVEMHSPMNVEYVMVIIPHVLIVMKIYLDQRILMVATYVLEEIQA